jgi:hypothetical protein
VALHLQFLEAFLLLLSLSPSLEGLNVALVVRTDAVTDGRKSTRFEQGRIPGGLRVLQETGGQPVVVIPLLDRVVSGREGKVFGSVGNQKLFEFCKERKDGEKGMVLEWIQEL